MTDLIAWLKSVVDLQKLAAVTVPGITAAVAVIMLFWPIEPLVFQGYPFAPVKGIDVPPVCDELSREAALESGGDGRMTGLDYASAQERRWRIEDCERQLQATIVREQEHAANLTTKIATEEKDAAAFAAQAQDYALKQGSLARTFESLAQIKISQVDADHQAAKANESRIAYYTSIATRWAEEQKAIVTRLHVVDGGEVFGDLVNKLTQRVGYVVLLALAFGFLVGPINKAIFDGWYTTARIKRLNRMMQRRGLRPLVTASETSLRPLLNPTYAIAVKLITQEDLDNLKSDKLRVAELAIGMVVPTVLLITAILTFVNGRAPDQFIRERVTPIKIQQAISGVGQ